MVPMDKVKGGLLGRLFCLGYTEVDPSPFGLVIQLVPGDEVYFREV